jgi:hypothetical protein
MIAMIGAPVLDPTCERLGLKYPCLLDPSTFASHKKRHAH